MFCRISGLQHDLFLLLWLLGHGTTFSGHSSFFPNSKKRLIHYSTCSNIRSCFSLAVLSFKICGTVTHIQRLFHSSRDYFTILELCSTICGSVPLTFGLKFFGSYVLLIFELPSNRRRQGCRWTAFRFVSLSMESIKFL